MKDSNIFAILSIASFLLDLNINPPRYMNTSQRGTSSQTNTWKTIIHSATTLIHRLSLSEVDLTDHKIETTKHGPCLMEVDWGGKIQPNYTSSGCILMQVDWGGKLRVNHINECMTSEVDWGAHETHQNGHNITKVDWGGYDPSPCPMDGYILSEVE